MNVLVKMPANSLIGFGYYPQVPNDLMDGFSGWTLDSLGNVRFLLNGAETGQSFVATDFDPQIESFFGTYDYVVDIGHLGPGPSMFFVGGTGASFDTTGFTHENTRYVGIFAVGPTADHAEFDNLELHWIPEPSSHALVEISGTLALCLCRKRVLVSR